MQDLLQYWHDALYRDLQCFADPRTDVDISVSGQRLEAMWWKRGKPRTEMFELSADGDFRWLGSGGHATYKTFLSSADMADLSQLAASTARLIDREPNYIATQATLDTAPDERNSNSEHAAADLLSGRITEALSSASGRTQLLFVRAGAGGGKTTLLRELTAAHAESFETTTDAHLLLYVSAQGRALSNLRDVLSSELDDLRAGFGRDALSALVRHGLIVPIIDGFDELLGAAGYGDAFGSLTEFLDSLDGEGVLLVSARSSFYEVEFIGRRPLLASRDGRYELEPVTLQAWNDSLVEQYLGKSLGQTGGLRAIQTLREQDRVLLGKPFFASQLPYFLDSHKDPDTAALGLVDFLIDRYIARESEKIVDRDGQALLPAAGHRRLFRWAADEMWRSENRRLRSKDLAALAEAVAEEEGLSSDSTIQLATKITSYAGFSLDRGGQDAGFNFEHDVYFDFFLAEVLRDQIAQGSGDLASLLDRGVLPREVIELTVDKGTAAKVLPAVLSVPREGHLYDNRRRNGGALVARALEVLGVLEDSAIRTLRFVNVAFGVSELTKVEFIGCEFSGVSLDHARFKGCNAIHCVWEGIVLGPETRLDVQGLTPGAGVRSVVELTDHGVVETYSPREISNVLGRLGAPIPTEGAPEYTEQAKACLGLLGRLVRRYRRANVLCEQDDNLRAVMAAREWPPLRKLLVDNEIVSVELRQTAGPPKTFLRLKVALPDLMAPENAHSLPVGPIGAFWRALRDT